MRDIIFRGKKVSNNEWAYGCLVNNIYGASKPIIITDSDYDDNNRVNFDWDFVIPQTVGQFTGFLDVNGKKIFEGDIVVSTSVNRLSNKPHIVSFENSYIYAMPERKPQVVGNIYDNPELLRDE